MNTPSGRRLVLLAAVALTLAACTGQTAEPDDGAGATLSAEATGAMTLRVWDEAAAAAYVESFAAFSTQQPNYSVDVEVVPRDQYAERLTKDLAAGEAPDLFWIDPTAVPELSGTEDIIDVGAALGEDHDAWLAPVTELFMSGSKTWAVPQLWQSIALYYDTEKLAAASVAPDELTWAPGAGAGDTLLGAARALTTDQAGLNPGTEGFDPAATTTWGFNAGPEVASVIAPFLTQNGVNLHDGERFTFASPEGEAAVQYLVDLDLAHRVAPPVTVAPDAATARVLFAQGRLAMLQAGSGDLRAIADAAGRPVGIAPMVAGPQGRIGVVNGVAVAANADSDQRTAVVTALRWLGSAAGQAALASQGVGLPAVTDAQNLYADYWAARDIDVTALLDAVREPALLGPSRVPDALTALEPVLQQMFRGEIPVSEGLRQAQAAANATLGPDATPTPTPVPSPADTGPAPTP
ncbi:MAG: ABC transporter substrate-binding protein [Georgenia sp.]